MASKMYYFSGVAEYPKLIEPTTNYDPSKLSWKINVKLDQPSRSLFQESGLGLKVKEGSVGFRRNTVGMVKGKPVDMSPPQVFNSDGTARTVPVNPGDNVTVKVEVYDTKAGKGHRLESVRVDAEGTGGPTVMAPVDDFVPF
jgi:hypothetical protein